MSYRQTIVCLANSRKHSGRCIAGKRLLEDGTLGEWIRPVSARSTSEISEEDMRFENGEHPKILDILEIQMIEAKPVTYQSENQVIDSRYYWIKTGTFPFEKLHGFVDRPESIWTNGNKSYYGLNDRILLQNAESLTNSLFLIKPENLEIQVRVEGAEFENPKRRVRAKFSYNGIGHSVIVTDPAFERVLLSKPENKTYTLKNDSFLCISLGEEYNNFCYKLAAAIIYNGKEIELNPLPNLYNGEEMELSPPPSLLEYFLKGSA